MVDILSCASRAIFVCKVKTQVLRVFIDLIPCGDWFFVNSANEFKFITEIPYEMTPDKSTSPGTNILSINLCIFSFNRVVNRRIICEHPIVQRVLFSLFWVRNNMGQQDSVYIHMIYISSFVYWDAWVFSAKEIYSTLDALDNPVVSERYLILAVSEMMEVERAFDICQKRFT